MNKLLLKIKTFFNKKSTIMIDSTNDDIIKLDVDKFSKNPYSIPVECFKNVLPFLCTKIKFRISSCLKEEFTQLFGTHNTTFKKEFLHYIWIVRFKGEQFEIFTSKRGTSYQIVAKYNENKSQVCIEFIDKITNLLISIK
jgi:hypothetical protein